LAADLDVMRPLRRRTPPGCWPARSRSAGARIAGGADKCAYLRAEPGLDDCIEDKAGDDLPRLFTGEHTGKLVVKP
jgi:hypothetical protein